ncbi:MAG: ABC transporter ATP-binding protein/permease [Lactobacillus sp.]|jgi:subfamily B ATP-binding cassette protein MsbA|nr:ABC transporter ATP-binding protein/permease [Lactobacillus sp.]
MQDLDSIQNVDFTRNYKRMWPFVKPYWFRALLAVLLSIPIGALDAVVAWALKPYMDVVLAGKADHSPLFIPLLIIGFTTFQGMLNYFATYLNAWVGVKINHDLKKALFNKLIDFETSFYDKTTSGSVVQRFASDADAACTGLLDNLKLFVSRLCSSLALIAVLIYNSWQLSIIAIVVLICALLPLAQLKRRIKSFVIRSVLEGSKVYSVYNETFAGNKTISSYNLKKKMFGRFEDYLKVLFKLSMKVTQKTAWLTPVMHIVVSIGIAAVIGYGSYLIINGTITAGNFVSFITALIMLYGPIKGIGKNFSAVQLSFLAIERVFSLLEQPVKIKNKRGAKPLDKIKKDIEFNDVWFEYNEGAPVLKGINLKVKAGTTIALVGNSGGGKTTIVNLLPRFYDVNKGSIKIDGVDVRDLKLESLRENIAVVFQDNFLFSGTIKENILMGKEDATDAQIEKALSMAYLDEFVAGLENGLDTEIGERGCSLSGGQKQRLAIARAFVKDAPVVILDEATSALDNKAEAIVQKAIDNLMKNRTVFVIAHRLSTVQNADKIVVLNDGEIVEEGKHENLLEVENGAYRALYNAQFKTRPESGKKAS